MSADRETNLDMNHTDITLLLADAADEVEIGTAPYDAVLRGGRRRKARRWAMATATALLLVGSAGTLAVAGLPGGDGNKSVAVATQPPTSGERHVYEPQQTELSRGTDRGKDWRVVISVWGPPRDRAEARGQLAAMAEYGIDAGARPELSGVVGKTSYFVSLSAGSSRPRVLIFDTVEKWDEMTGRDIVYGALSPSEDSGPGPDSLAVGRVARTAQQVKCTWSDGTTSVDLPKEAAGSPLKWFVCVGPEGTENRTAGVIQ
ncbi:hypothetical protein [Streptomyces curacoi]|uniref:Uncharacterized protein n=1 Tax=Streptomyces curacoi TaxID=146536 RepID=A0A124H724_9ACTN|nr:hypothetical protein [Streptomyces curacoi]KUM81002.1 hypothetical protein AQI70_03140 [Streptomyces curacoi]